MRRVQREGRREREARKRHRRGRVWPSYTVAGAEPLKLGRKHFLRFARNSEWYLAQRGLLASVVADVETFELAKGVEEFRRQH